MDIVTYGLLSNRIKNIESGSITIPETFTANVTIGGISAGTEIKEGDNLTTIIKSMLLKYIKPSITLNINPSSTLYYYGQSIPSENLAISITNNNGKISKIEVNRGDTLLSTKEDVNGLSSFEIIDSTPITDTITYNIAGFGSDDVSASKTITFCNPTFFGTVESSITSPSASDILRLSNKLAINNKKFSYSNINVEYGKILYAYPKSFGELTSITDGVNNYFDSYDKNEVTVSINNKDVIYYAYLLKDATGVENFKQVYS